MDSREIISYNIFERGIYMKKRLLMFLFAGLMLLSLAAPAMATDVISVPLPGDSERGLIQQSGMEMEPRNEQTQIYFRTFNGVLQFRVWGVTSARWLTEWANVVN